MTLPPEVMDKILEHIHVNGWKSPTLCACALVATWWTGPSQRRLFSSVKIHPNNYKRWMNGVVLSKSKAHLLGHVRSLSDIGGYEIRILARFCGEYLSALQNLDNLWLYTTTIEHIGENEFHTCFSAFRETLTNLSLYGFATSFSAFVTLIDYFPNITTLQLHSFDLKPDKRPVPSLSRPLRGKLELSFDYRKANSHEFVNRFAELELEYEELVIVSPSSIRRETEILQSALRVSTSTVKFLKVTAELEREHSLSTLIKTISSPLSGSRVQTGVAAAIRDFRQLEQLELAMYFPRFSHKVPLNAITSTELRKIVLSSTNPCVSTLVGCLTEDWVLVDNQLCELLFRLRAMGYRHTLEVELQFLKVRGNPEKRGFTKLLPRFREKGIVTVVNAAYGGGLLRTPLHS